MLYGRARSYHATQRVFDSSARRCKLLYLEVLARDMGRSRAFHLWKEKSSLHLSRIPLRDGISFVRRDCQALPYLFLGPWKTLRVYFSKDRALKCLSQRNQQLAHQLRQDLQAFQPAQRIRLDNLWGVRLA